MLQAQLKVVGGKHDGKLILLPKKFLVGRETDCHLRPNNDLVSRHHCVFTLDDYTLRLRDLGSTNGTFVNNEWIKSQVVLKAGDHVRIGKLEFEVVLQEVAGSAKPAALNAAALLGDSAMASESPAGKTMTEIKIPAPEELDRLTPPPQQGQKKVPDVVSGDTTVLTGQQLQPQQQQPVPAQLQYPPQAYPQYPGYYPQYPGYYPQYPGYGMPQQYPQQGYPQQYPQQGYPQQQAPQQNTATQSPGELPVQLPDPSATGAQPVAPTQPVTGSTAPKNNPAANIIQNFINRKPTQE